MKIALAQMKMKTTLQENIDNSIKLIKKAAENNAKLICFPELQFSIFFPQYQNVNADIYLMKPNSKAITKIQKVCKDYKIAAILNFYLFDNNKKYNVSPMIDTDGSILGLSKMVHIVQYKQFYEQDYYTPSNEGFKVYDTSIGRVGIVICFDRHYPESIRSCGLQKAELIVIPSAISSSDDQTLFDWEMRVSSMHNSTFIAMCNRTGTEENMVFTGGSIVTSPTGALVTKADNKEQILYAELDFNQCKKLRKEKQYFELRRPEMYGN